MSGDLVDIKGPLDGLAYQRAMYAGQLDWSNYAPRKAVVKLVDYFVDPCTVPVLLCLKLAGVAAGQTIAAFLIPDLGEIVENLVEPKGADGCDRARARKDRHRSARRKGGLRAGSWIPDVDGMIATRIENAVPLGRRTPSAGEWMAWRVFNAYERGMFFLMLIGLLGEFFYNWLMLIEGTKFCAAQQSPMVRIERDFGVMTTQNSWVPIPVFYEGITRPRAIIRFANWTVWDEPTRTVAQITLMNDTVFVIEVGFQLVADPFDGPPIVDQRTTLLAPGQEWTVACYVEAPPGATIYVATRHNLATITWRDLWVLTTSQNSPTNAR